MATDAAADDTDVGSALSDLGDSMAELNTNTTGLGDAVEQLRAATQRLCEQQTVVSEQMSKTVQALDRDSGAAPTATPASAGPSAVADD
ncbi:hypothetical protein [Haloarcula laminariae]|uniref:hypothetical protein n=1 Tax=Haloarcula laminariae TaxID=2961577 RepID=UPI0021C7A8CF|nr:hypothetical protein [Halomicroarcula laminariae]